VDPLGADATLPSILSEKQFIDLREDTEDGYRLPWHGLVTLDLLGVEPWNPKDSLYLGLHAYEEQHAAVFFGRGAEIHAGLELLDRGTPGPAHELSAAGPYPWSQLFHSDG